MNHLKSLVLLPLCLCLMLICNADKIEKKGTILNSNCNPIGTKCMASAQAEISYTYFYNEPKPSSFSLQITEQEVSKHPAIQNLLKNKSSIYLEEAMQIPDDVIRALKMPSSYSVPKGTYNIRYHQNIYTIIFKD